VRAIDVVEQSIGDGQREIAGAAAFADGGRVPVYLQFPDAGPHPAPGDVFLPMLLVPAMALHEDLHIDAPVSRSLLDAANESVGPVLAAFHPRLERVEIRAAEVADDADAVAPPTIGSFFSHGLDSRWTLMRRQTELTHLVYIHGFDLNLDASGVLAELASRARAVADAAGLELVELRGNGRRQLNRAAQQRFDARGPRQHFSETFQLGSLLTSFGQGLAGQVGKMVIASSWRLEDGGAHGSHPWIEGNWSTPRIRFELDGSHASRIERARELAEKRPDLLRGVRVCWRRPHRVENCGQCGKCLRLRMELELADVAPGEGPFDDALDHRALRRARIVVSSSFWGAILEEARRRGDREAQRTAEILLGLRRHPGRELMRARRELRRVRRRVRTRFARRTPR